MNLDVRTLILAASIAGSAPLNLVSANPAPESPAPSVQEEDVKDGSPPTTSTGVDDDDGPKAARREPKKNILAKVRSPQGAAGLESELRCLALNIYHEAGAESATGKQAVAAVTLNRVKSKAFPRSICGVVKQRDKKSCQFSWVCERPAQPEQDSQAWQESLAIARKTLKGEHQDPTQGALYFHATRVRPDWSRTFKKTARIGNHIFYKPVKSAA